MAYDEDDKLLNKQRVSFYNFFILISLGIGSWGFGFAGAISSSTIGMYLYRGLMLVAHQIQI